MKWVSEDGRTEVSVSPMTGGEAAERGWVVLEIVTPFYPSLSKQYGVLVQKIEDARHRVFGYQRVFDASNVPVTTPGMQFDLRPGWVWLVTLQDDDKRMRYQFLGKPVDDYDQTKSPWVGQIGQEVKQVEAPKQHDPEARHKVQGSGSGGGSWNMGKAKEPTFSHIAENIKTDTRKRRLRAYGAQFDFLIGLMRTDYVMQPGDVVKCVEGVPPDAKYLYTRSDDNGVYLIFEHPSFDELEVREHSIIPFGKVVHSTSKKRSWWRRLLGWG